MKGTITYHRASINRVPAQNSVRREMLMGREYIVAPVTMIVPGVLNGSNGPIYYPPDELGADPDAWNGIPLVVYHPMVNVDGEEVPTSARQPEILKESGIGFVFGTRYEDALRGEAWFDVELTQSYDTKLAEQNRMMPRLERGQPIEMSTGLFSMNVPCDTENGKAIAPDGREYTHTATNMKPDHLAVLPDDIGACSLRDGCGINVNVENQESTTTTTEVLNVDKAALVKWLNVNCECFKGDEKTLNTFDVERLKKLKNAVIATRVANAAKKGFSAFKLTKNADGEGAAGEVAPGVSIADLAGFLGVEANPAEDPVGFTSEIKAKLGEIVKRLGGADAPPAPAPTNEGEMEEEEVKEEEVVMSEGDPLDPPPPEPTGNKKTQTMKQWLASMPAEARPVWAAMVNTSKEKRKELLTAILNGVPQGKRTALFNKLKSKSLDELQDLLTLSGKTLNSKRKTRTEDDETIDDLDLPMFNGAGGGGTVPDDEYEELPMPSLYGS